jgi:predicted MFS family arabinose efflux permease
VLAGTDVVFALGLVALAKAQGPEGLFGASIILGVGMGSGLYEAAFAALVRLYGHGSRDAITGITLIAGFASTVGWPLSTLMEHEVSWRGACYTWAGLHILIGLPLNLMLPKASMQTFSFWPEHFQTRSRVPALTSASAMACPIVPRPMKPIGYAASIIEPPHCSARARCFDEEPHTSRVGRSPLHEGGSEERYQR